jgi:hypothetical protein
LLPSALSSLFFSFSSSNSVQEEFKRENQTRRKEFFVVSVLVKVEAFFFSISLEEVSKLRGVVALSVSLCLSVSLSLCLSVSGGFFLPLLFLFCVWVVQALHLALGVIGSFFGVLKKFILLRFLCVVVVNLEGWQIGAQIFVFYFFLGTGVGGDP